MLVKAGGDVGAWQTGLAYESLAESPTCGVSSNSHAYSLWIAVAGREGLAGRTGTREGRHSCVPSGALRQISELQCFSFQKELWGEGYEIATQFPLDRKQQFRPTNCGFFLENNPRNESVKGAAQNRLLFQLATAEYTCAGLFLSSLYKNNFHNFKSFFQVTQSGFISRTTGGETFL